MMRMHIHWLLPEHFEHNQQVVSSAMASCRLRAGALWKYLQTTHHTLTVGETLDESADVCVVGKVGAFDTRNKHHFWMEQLRKFKGAITLDVTDDHLSYTTVMSAFYFEALELAHQVVCSSRWLQEVVSQRFKGPVTVIDDAIEVPVIPPKDQTGDPLRLLWFGHPTNIKGLIEFLPHLPARRPLELSVVSSPQGLQMLHGAKINAGGTLGLKLRVWSPSEMLRVARDSDACIIPIEQTTARKAGVSTNRLLTAMTLGLPTAADTTLAYAEYSAYFANLRTDEFDSLLQAPLSRTPMLREFQREFPARFSMPAIGHVWFKHLSQGR